MNDDKLKAALHEIAIINGLNAAEYLILLEKVDRLLDDQVNACMEYVHGITPEHTYDINGKEDF